MELLERYLEAVQFFLPKKQKKDIIAELSEDLHSQIEEKETELGRKLEEAELEAILKRCGSPLVVASRYRPQQYLIGPAMFPLYRFALVILLLGCVIPRFLVWIGFLIFDPADRGYLNMGNMVETIIFFAFFTTLTFAIIERTELKLQLLQYWSPRKLPPVRDPHRIPRATSLAEIAAAAIFIGWFIQAFWPREIMNVFGTRITLAPAWSYFFSAFLLLMACNLVLSSVNFFRPYWTQRRAGLRVVIDVASAATFCWLLKAQILSAISVPGVSEPKAIELTNTINFWMAKSLPWAVVLLVAILLLGIYRIVRLRVTRLRCSPIESVVNGVANSMVR
jgi:hypothetical protein